MAETILIDATQAEEVRVATVDQDKQLCDLIVEPTRQNQRTGNIYKAVVRRCEPSLAAYFVDFGGTRDGFLAFKELAPEYVKSEGRGKPSYENCLKIGQEIIVRVVKDERIGKGAALTTYISLAGFYSVLMPNKPKAGGISRHIEGDDRDELKQAISEINVPRGMGVIVRTAGLGRSTEELQWDINNLLKQWDEIQTVATTRKGPFLIRQESDVLMRAIRDHIRPSVEQIIINEEKTYEAVKEFIGKVRPDFVNKVKLHKGTNPLYNEYKIESQIETAFTRVVELSNGASIVLDQTEALLAIDINSAKATEGSDIEETAFLTNLAAAKEISRQLRLRDAGGLVVIDFIDMKSTRHQREVEEAVSEALKSDRARVQVGRISRFGLLELSRQRLRSSLGDANQDICPRCDGYGRLRSAQSLALSILRLIEESAMRANITGIRVQAPVEVATYLTNEKRSALAAIESQHQVQAMIIANPALMTPQYKIDLLRDEEAVAQLGPSFMQAQAAKVEDESLSVKKSEQPAIKSFVSADMPQAPTPGGDSLVKRIWKAIFGSEKTSDSDNKKHTHGRNNQHRNRRGSSQNRRHDSERGDRPRRNTRNPRKNTKHRSNEEQNTNTESNTRNEQPRKRKPQEKQIAQHEKAARVEPVAVQDKVVSDNNQEQAPDNDPKRNNRRTRGSRLHGRRRRSERTDNNQAQSTEQTNNTAQMAEPVEHAPVVKNESKAMESLTEGPRAKALAAKQQAVKTKPVSNKQDSNEAPTINEQRVETSNSAPASKVEQAPTPKKADKPEQEAQTNNTNNQTAKVAPANVLKAPALPTSSMQPIKSKIKGQAVVTESPRVVTADKLPASARERRTINSEPLVQIKSGESQNRE